MTFRYFFFLGGGYKLMFLAFIFFLSNAYSVNSKLNPVEMFDKVDLNDFGRLLVPCLS